MLVYWVWVWVRVGYFFFEISKSVTMIRQCNVLAVLGWDGVVALARILSFLTVFNAYKNAALILCFNLWLNLFTPSYPYYHFILNWCWQGREGQNTCNVVMNYCSNNGIFLLPS